MYSWGVNKPELILVAYNQKYLNMQELIPKVDGIEWAGTVLVKKKKKKKDKW